VALLAGRHKRRRLARSSVGHRRREPRVRGRRVLLDECLRERKHPAGATVAIQVVQQRRSLRLGEAVGEVLDAWFRARSGRVPVVRVVVHLLVEVAVDEASLLQAPHVQVARLVHERVAKETRRARKAAGDTDRVRFVRDVALRGHTVGISDTPMSASLARFVAPALVLAATGGHEMAFHGLDNGFAVSFQLGRTVTLALGERGPSKNEQSSESNKKILHDERKSVTKTQS